MTLLRADANHDGASDGSIPLVTGLDRPHGLALRDGYLYVAAGELYQQPEGPDQAEGKPPFNYKGRAFTGGNIPPATYECTSAYAGRVHVFDVSQNAPREILVKKDGATTRLCTTARRRSCRCCHTMVASSRRSN